ncbi:MAG: amidase [Minwuia sp.]|uniref:amidase n=1 Tax=Minwuia sp. TaxID=2493630 RepID=UPI003A887AE8
MIDRGLKALAGALASGETSSAALTDAALAAAAEGEGPTAYMTLHADRARAEAAAVDGLRTAGREARPFAGIPISIKDLFDEEGFTTTAGSKALAGASPATADAPIVDRLRRAGFVILGRTVMTEFAYSGVGLNPHYGTPASPWDRETRRIPGGSTSGGAVSVADGMAAATIGTDTGGSCRIPAAFCGIAGFKPTIERVPREGATPLAFSLDSIGPLANSADCCAILDDVMAGGPGAGAAPAFVGGLRIGVLRNYVLDDMDQTVARTFGAALTALSEAGAQLEDLSLPEIDELPALYANGGYAAAESWAWHRDLIERKGDLYDPRVIGRIRRGADISAADYIDLLEAHAAMKAATDAATAHFDAVVMPTVPIVAPAISELDADEDYTRINLLCLRNCSAGNFLNRPNISLPCHKPGEAPVGLMLMGHRNRDRELLNIAAGVEGALAA